jgi:uncharacterized integral membrane protein
MGVLKTKQPETAPATDSQSAQSRKQRRTPRKGLVGLALGALGLLFVATLIVQNNEHAELDVLRWTWGTSLWLVVSVGFLIGNVVGLSAPPAFRHHRAVAQERERARRTRGL